MEMGVKSSFVVMAHIVTAGTLEKGQCSWWISVLAKGQGGDIFGLYERLGSGGSQI